MPVTVTFEPDSETYLHRIGRCGRFGKLGTYLSLLFIFKHQFFFLLRLGYTFNLIGSEKDYKVMKEIEEHFSHPIEEISIEGLSQLEQDQL